LFGSRIVGLKSRGLSLSKIAGELKHVASLVASFITNAKRKFMASGARAEQQFRLAVRADGDDQMQRRSSIEGEGQDLAARLLFCPLITLAAVTFANAEMKPLNPFAAEVGPAETAPATPPPSAFVPNAAQQSPGAFSGIFGWVLRTQQSLQRDLSTRVKSLKGEHALAGAFMLAALSFIYGVVHAVGPGHGTSRLTWWPMRRPFGAA
jgi:hypothetical protein